MIEKKNRKKKIITSLAVGGSLLLGGGLLAKKLLNKKVINLPNNLTVTKQTPSISTPKQVSEVIQPTEINTSVIKKPVEQKLLNSTKEENKVLGDLPKRKSDRKRATGNKQPDLPKQPRQKLDVKKREGLDLPKTPRKELYLKLEPPQVDEVYTPINKLNNLISSTVFPKSKLKNRKINNLFKNKLKIKVETPKPNVKLPKKLKLEIDTPIQVPKSIEDIRGRKKVKTYEDVIKEGLEDSVINSAPKLLMPSLVPPLGRIVKVKGYKKRVGGKIVSVKPYTRVNDRAAVLVNQVKDDGLDQIKRDTFRNIRKLREAIRKRKEQRIVNDLQYEKVLDDQKVFSNNFILETDNLKQQLNTFFLSIENNLKQINYPRYNKTYSELSKIDLPNIKIEYENIEVEKYQSSLQKLRDKVLDVIEGFDPDGKILSEIKIERQRNLDELLKIRKNQTNIENNINKEINRAKDNKKVLLSVLEDYRQKYNKYIKEDKDYYQLLDDIRLKKQELLNVSPSEVGKEFYTKKRIELINELDKLERGVSKESDFIRELTEKIKELDLRVAKLGAEKIKVKKYNTTFFKELNNIEGQIYRIPTNKFFLNTKETRLNEKIGRILNKNLEETNKYLDSIEQDIKKRIDNPLKKVENGLQELEKKVEDIDLDTIRKTAESNVKERELEITKKDFIAEKQLEQITQILEDTDGLKEIILRSSSEKGVFTEALKKGEILTLDKALEMKRKLVAKLRVEAMSANNQPAKLAERSVYSFGNVELQPTHPKYIKAKEMPHLSYVRHIKSELLNERANLKIQRDTIFSSLSNYDFESLKQYLNYLKEKDLFSYYKNTDPELYKKLLLYQDFLDNKIQNRFQFILEDIDFKLDYLDKRIIKITKELDEIEEIKPKIIIRQEKKLIDDTVEILNGEDTFKLVDDFVPIDEKAFDERIRQRHLKINDIARATRKRTTLIPLYEYLNRNGFKVEGNNSIFNNYRSGKLTPAQKQFINKLSPTQRKFFEEIIEKNLDEESIQFFYLNRALDYVNSNSARKKKIKKVRSLIDSFNVARGADLRNKNRNVDIRLTVQEKSGQLVLENYEQLNGLTKKELEILSEIEKQLGLDESNKPLLSNLTIVAKIYGSELVTKEQVTNLIKEIEINKDKISLNEYTYFSSLLKEKIRGLSNDLYLNNFSQTLEIVRF